MELLQNIMVYVVLLTLLLSLMALSYSEDKIKKQKKKLNREIEINEERLEELRELRKDYKIKKELAEEFEKAYNKQSIKIDEVHILLETLLVTKKQKDRTELVNNFTFNK